MNITQLLKKPIFIKNDNYLSLKFESVFWELVQGAKNIVTIYNMDSNTPDIRRLRVCEKELHMFNAGQIATFSSAVINCCPNFYHNYSAHFNPYDLKNALDRAFSVVLGFMMHCTRSLCNGQEPVPQIWVEKMTNKDVDEWFNQWCEEMGVYPIISVEDITLNTSSIEKAGINVDVFASSDQAKEWVRKMVGADYACFGWNCWASLVEYLETWLEGNIHQRFNSKQLMKEFFDECLLSSTVQTDKKIELNDMFIHKLNRFGIFELNCYLKRSG